MRLPISDKRVQIGRPIKPGQSIQNPLAAAHAYKPVMSQNNVRRIINHYTIETGNRNSRKCRRRVNRRNAA